MTDANDANTNDDRQEFLNAADESQGGLISDFIGFMRENAKWWLIPFLIVFALLGALLIFGSGAVAPFIYTIF